MGLQACTHPPNSKRKERAMREKEREGSPFKNAENDYFDQLLECAAPKRWLNYTTTKGKGGFYKMPQIPTLPPKCPRSGITFHFSIFPFLG